MRLTPQSDEAVLEAVGETWIGHGSPAPRYPQISHGLNEASIPAGLAFQARDGRTYILRRVTPADVGLLNVFVYRLSDQARRMRFMTGQPCSPHFVRAQVARMLGGAAGSAITLLATELRGGPGAVIGVAELACDRERAAGEVGVVVLDDAQRKGIGSALLRQVLQVAQELGLKQLHGDMYATNRAIQRLIQAHRLSYTSTIQSSEMHIVVRVPD